MKIERHKVTPGSPEWKALRRRDVTASTAAALLGVHPYETPLTLHMEKAGLGDDEETEAMERGKLLEGLAIELLRRRYPSWRVERNGLYYRAPDLRLGATPDVKVIDPERGRGIVQIKSVEPSIFRRNWTIDGAVEPPLWIAVQAIIEAKLTKVDFCDVAAIRVGHGIDFDLYPIPLHDAVFSRIVDEVGKFWSRFDAGERPKADYDRDMAALASLYGEDDGETVDLSASNRFPVVVAELEDARARIKEAREDESRARAEILDLIGSAAKATGPEGLVVTAKSFRKASYVVKEQTQRPIKVKRENTNGKSAS